LSQFRLVKLLPFEALEKQRHKTHLALPKPNLHMTTLKTLRYTVIPCMLFAAAPILRAVDAPTATNQPPAATTPKKLKELPPGNHRLLETMTKSFDLTMDQQLEIEPILHDEESVTKPILGFAPLTQEEKQAMLLTIKHAARRQIRPLLTPEQQQKLDKEDASLTAKSGGGGKKGGSGKKAPAASTEESLTSAILKYEALTHAEQESLLAQVKQAARRAPNSAAPPAQP
jgi:Spy/CpxP family protein refolding chaperone